MKKLILFHYLVFACTLAATTTTIDNAVLTGAPNLQGTLVTTNSNQTYSATLTIDATKPQTSVSLTGNVTETFSGIPDEGAKISRWYYADSTARTVTPDNNSGAVWFYDAGTTGASFTVPANGRRFVTYQRLSGSWVAYGTGVPTVGAGAFVQGDQSVSSADSPQFTGVNVGHASDTTITRVAAGVIAVEGATLATQSYAVSASYAAHLGTFASPDTTAGAITWTAPVLTVFTSAAAATRTYTLPAASGYAGQAVIVYVAAGTNHVNIQPSSGAQLVLGGALLTANHYAQLSGSAAGNYICFLSDGTNWTSLGSSGGWLDSASP